MSKKARNPKLILATLATCVTVIGACIYALQGPTQQAFPDATAKLDSSKATPKAKPAIQQDRPLTRMAPSRPSTPSARIAQTSPTPSSDPAPDHGEPIEPQDDEEQPFGEAFAQRFTQESTNRDWATQSEQKIQQIFESESLAAFSVEEMECRSTICKVRINYKDDATDPMDFIASLEPTLHLWEGESSFETITDSDGRTHTTAFFAAG